MAEKTYTANYVNVLKYDRTIARDRAEHLSGRVAELSAENRRLAALIDERVQQRKQLEAFAIEAISAAARR